MTTRLNLPKMLCAMPHKTGFYFNIQKKGF